MARAPGWMKPVFTQRDASGLTVTYRIRGWHPSVVPFIWEMLDVKPAILKPFIVLWAWLYMACRTMRNRSTT